MKFAGKLHRRKASPYQGRWHRAKRRCRRGCTEQHLRYSAHSKGVLCPTSQSRCRSTAPLKRGAIDKEISFRSNTRCCDKTSPPQSLPLSGEVARRRRDGEVWPAPPPLIRGGGIERSEDVGEVSSPQKQIPHTGRLRCGGAGMESGNVFNRFCHRRQRCGSCHRRCRCTAPGRGRCAPRPPHRWGRGLQWQKPCSGSRCRPCR